MLFKIVSTIRCGPWDEKCLNPLHVTSRIRLKLAPCEKHRHSDTGMSNFCGPNIAQVYLSLPLEMRILQILWSWDFTRLGVPSWPTEQRNPLMSYFCLGSQSRHIYWNTNSRDNTWWASGLRPFPTFFCFNVQNVIAFLNQQMIPSLWPSSAPAIQSTTPQHYVTSWDTTPHVMNIRELVLVGDIFGCCCFWIFLAPLGE